MHPNKPGQATNKLSGQASLLLSASKPTVVDSPLQKSINKSTSYSDDDLPEDNAINFIKPQNEIFKKLDGKIQKIVAAHSTMNKMYALNDFSGVGPKKPIELPPQLPRPPPWVPKVSSDFNCSQWAEDTLNTLNRSSLSIDFSESSSRQGPSSVSLNRATKINSRQLEIKPQFIKAPALTIDSAISKIHQRRQQQQQRPQQISSQHLRHSAPISQPPRLSTQARLLQQAHELQQQLKVAAASPHKNQHVDASLTTSSTRDTIDTSLPSTSRNESGAQIGLARKSIQLGTLLQMQKRANEQQTGVTICPSLTPEEKRRFQNELINIFRQEIAAVTKLAKLKFSPQASERPKTSDQRSLLIKKSPQSLFNTIRRETSLLLKRGDLQQSRPSTSGVSLLTNRRPPMSAQTLISRHNSNTTTGQTVPRLQVHRFHTIKVVVPPSEFHKHSCAKHTTGKDNGSECNCYESKAELLDIDQWLPSRKFALKYQTLQMKLSRLKFFPRRDEYNRKRGYCVSMTPADARRRKSPQKSLDKIVDRLQARCFSSTSTSPVQGSKVLLPSSSPNPSQASREPTPSPPSSPRPIPVYRTMPPQNKGNNSYLGNSQNNSKIVNIKSKKAKRLHRLGLKLSNYLERENPTPATERLTVEQFAKCLNLVRSNDASLKRHQEKLLQSEMKWRLPVGDRPLRLRRIRGERVHMPASASYRATSKIGLQ